VAPNPAPLLPSDHLKSTAVLLGSVIVVAAVLRGWQAGESLWLDELHTSWTVSGSLSEVAERAAIGNQSPLYFWLAWFFARLPISPEIALRLPSLLAGCALPLALYWLATLLATGEKKDTSDPSALLAAWLVAVDPQAIFYSQEARPYALLILAAVIHFGLLILVMRRTTFWPRPLWVLTGALLVHFNYTGGLILLAEFIALVLMGILVDRKKELASRNDVFDFLLTNWLDFVALIILLLPAISGALAVADRRENWEQFVKPKPWEELFLVFPWTLAVVPITALYSWRAVVAKPQLVLLVTWLMVPLLIAWLLTQLDVAALFHQRYVIAALPASLLAGALLIRLGTNQTTQSILIGIVLAVSVYQGGLVRNCLQDGRILHDRNEDWRAAVAALNGHLAADDKANTAVLVGSGLIEADDLPRNSAPLFREYCSCPVRGMYRLQAAAIHPLAFKNPGKLVPPLREELRNQPRIWIIARSTRKREQLLADLRQSIWANESWDPEPAEFFGQVYLQQIQLRKSSLPAGD
jgi:mannosyltransferase